MQYCKKCKVTVAGDKQRCPLCQESLCGCADEKTEIFPIPEKPKYSKHFLLKLVTFISITAAVINVGLNNIFPMENDIKWSLFVVLGIICAWISTSIVIIRRRNILKTINWQLFLVTIFAIFWDYLTGWRGWSIDYVIPFSCMASMTCMYILSLALKIDARGYVAYILFDVLYGAIPIIFIFTDSLNTTYPSILCVVYSVISAAGVVIFNRRIFTEELKRKFHI